MENIDKKVMNQEYPDAKKHQFVSFIKSGIRIFLFFFAYQQHRAQHLQLVSPEGGGIEAFESMVPSKDLGENAKPMNKDITENDAKKPNIANI